MPETVTCPNCHVTLKPKTPVPAGTRIKCPKCQTVFAVPGDEAAPAVARPAPPKPAPPPAEEERVAEEAYGADDAAERGDEAPVKPKKKGVPLWVWLTSAAGALVLLSCGCCGVAYFALPGMLGLQQGAESGSVSSTNFDKLQKGMTEDQVKGILGEPTLHIELGGVKADTWRKGADNITVSFQNGKAVDRNSQIAGTTKHGW